ncbi:MAG: sigma-54-dependent transcriptional regulator [Planctomycetota bacterium]
MIAAAGNRILITDDEMQTLESLAGILRANGYAVSSARSAAEALALMRREPFQLLITDMQMPNMDGLELAREARKEWPNLPVVILTGHGTIDHAVNSMRLGAADFIVKPLDPTQLLVRIERCLEERALRSEVSRLSEAVRRSGRYGEIIGANRAMREIFDVIERVANRPSIVLIHGEPGTGKELIARAIHRRNLDMRLPPDLSPSEREHLRKSAEVNSPYIGVNCGAFARNLLESQLFGHKKGTFTGAIADQEGVFVAARHGTLFLDEITELDIDLQVNLLRAIAEREVTPLGATQSQPVHARIITATNRDIAQLVKDGKFRADLYYRINVVNIHVPPLRERIDDLPLLVDYFMQSVARSYRVAPREVTRPVMETFQSYSWPGNVRELQNVIERAFALGRDDARLTVADLPLELAQSTEPRVESKNGDEHVFPSLDQIVRGHIVRALQASRGVKSRAATLLRIDRNRLYRFMDRYRIERGS